MTRPGCTRAQEPSGAISRMRFMYRVKSTWMPAPTAPPAKPEPMPRPTRGSPCSAQYWTRRTTSSVSRGETTPSGVTWLRPASVA